MIGIKLNEVTRKRPFPTDHYQEVNSCYVMSFPKTETYKKDNQVFAKYYPYTIPSVGDQNIYRKPIFHLDDLYK
jgi:hypothetical protein